MIRYIRVTITNKQSSCVSPRAFFFMRTLIREFSPLSRRDCVIAATSALGSRVISVILAKSQRPSSPLFTDVR